MQRRNHTQAPSSTTTHIPSLPDFHDYVQDLETKGLVKREPVTQNGRTGITKTGRDDYHYEMKARRVSTPKPRPNHEKTSGRHNATLNGNVGSCRRTFSTSSPIYRQRGQFRRLDCLPRPETLASSLTASNKKPSQCVSSTTGDALTLAKRIKTCNAFEVLLAARNDHLDVGGLEKFLLITARTGDFTTFEKLLNACESELPWSSHLYPSFLHSLAVAAVSLKPTSNNAKTIFLQGGRLFEHSGIDPTRRIKSLHEAGAFPLVLAAYHHSPGHRCSPEVMAMVLESALRIAVLGMDHTSPVQDIFRSLPKDAHFLRTFPQIYERIPVPAGSRGRFHLTVLRWLSQACIQHKSSGMFDMLDINLKKCITAGVSPARFYDVGIEVINGDEPCYEKCYSRLLFCFRALSNGHESILEEKLLELGLQKNFLKTIESFEKQHHVYQSPAVAQARLQLDGAGVTNFTAEDVNALVSTLRSREDLVMQLFRRCYHLEMTTYTLQRCWTAMIQNSTEDAVVEFLDEIQKQSSSFSYFHLERIRAVLLQQTWRSMHNFGRVQALFEHMNKFRSRESKEVEAGILSKSMIVICAQAGRWEEAKHYVWDARHLNPIAKAKLKDVGVHYETVMNARKGQWDLVQRNLRFTRVKRSGIKQDPLFLEVLRIFSQQHPPQKVLAFCKWALGSAGASPTQQIFDIVISSCLAQGDQRLVSRTLAFMREHDFQWEIRAATVVMAFRKYANRFKPKSVSFIQCLEGLRGYPKLLSKDVCLILMERCSVAARRLRIAGRERLHLAQKRGQEKLVAQVTHLENLASTAPWMSQQKDGQSNSMGNPLLERAQAYYIKMQVESSQHHWQEVVSLFEDSLKQNLPRLELSLCLAVDACLKLNDPTSGVTLIRHAQTFGFATTKAEVSLTSQSALDLEVCSASELRRRVHQHYVYLQSQYLPLDHGLLVHAAHTLVLKSQAAASVALLSEVYRSSFAKIQPFDIVVMTSFLTAYSRVFDVEGVRWTVQTIIAKQVLFDIHFFRSLAQARYRICASLLKDGQRKRSKEVVELFKIWDLICWRRYEQQQRNVIITGRVMTNMLVRLYMKDAAWGRLDSQVRVRRQRSRKVSRASIQARFQRKRVADTEKRLMDMDMGASYPQVIDGALSALPEEQRVGKAFSVIGDWEEDEEEREALIPPNEKEVQDAISKLLGDDLRSSQET